MAQIPSSNITMTAIATEVGVSTSSISMANLRNNSISYVNSDETKDTDFIRQLQNQGGVTVQS